jgi:hypothetical protein
MFDLITQNAQPCSLFPAGNTFFKQNDCANAIRAYSEAIDLLPKPPVTIAVSATSDEPKSAPSDGAAPLEATATASTSPPPPPAAPLSTPAEASGPPSLLAVLYGNRAACHQKLEAHKDVRKYSSAGFRLTDFGCRRLRIAPPRWNSHLHMLRYCIAAPSATWHWEISRRRRKVHLASSFPCFITAADYQAVLKLDPGNRDAASALERMPALQKEQEEKMKAEAMVFSLLALL